MLCEDKYNIFEDIFKISDKTDDRSVFVWDQIDLNEMKYIILHPQSHETYDVIHCYRLL